uniref:Uncharacterized protein n=1 Tax=Rhizophora mucronata TaxID=61149 RepID=A0A2P2KT58_RHIMU
MDPLQNIQTQPHHLLSSKIPTRHFSSKKSAFTQAWYLSGISYKEYILCTISDSLRKENHMHKSRIDSLCFFFSVLFLS